MEIHYIINDTMRPLAEEYFLQSLPSGFSSREHRTPTWTSGNFNQDNYTRVIVQRTDLIVKEISSRLDGGVMLWADVDIYFFNDCVEEFRQLSLEKDLIFQKETAREDDFECNFGLQLIRRNEKTLKFYERLSLLQKLTENAHDQHWGNRLLRFEGHPSWGHLPLRFSSESNGGIRSDSILYHANCTPFESVVSKSSLIEQAIRRHRDMNAPVE